MSASILVGTVHALQGSEREYIIVSFVRSIDADQDVVTSVAKTPGDSVALQDSEGGPCSFGDAAKFSKSAKPAKLDRVEETHMDAAALIADRTVH